MLFGGGGGGLSPECNQGSNNTRSSIPALTPVSSSLPHHTTVTQLGDKSDLIKKGTAPHEASSKVAGSMQSVMDATRDWVNEGIRLSGA